MKTVHATWEKRNLGREAWEITLDRKDMEDVPGVIKALDDETFKGAYVCVKLPVGNLKMVHALEDDGFRFLEVQLSLISHFEPTNILSHRESMGNVEFKIVEKTPEAWERIIQKVPEGLFDTDRISLDPMFGPDVARRRYQNWMRDLLANPKSRLTVMVVDGKEIAFGLDIIDECRVEGVLGATFEDARNSGYGMLSMAGYHENGLSMKLRTAVSSNNLVVLRTHQNCGRVVYKEMYVFRKIYT